MATVSTVEYTSFIIYRVKSTESMNIAFEEVYVNVTGLQRWFIEFKTDDLSLENKPGERPGNAIDNNV